MNASNQTEQDILAGIDEASGDETNIESPQPTETPTDQSAESSSASDAGEQQQQSVPTPQPDQPTEEQHTPQPGAERRLYEAARTLRERNQQLTREIEELRESKVDTLGGVPEKLGLSHDEVQTGLGAIAAFKKNPLNATRWMIQQAISKGVTLQEIIGDAGAVSSMELSAVRALIDEKLGPLLSDREAAIQQQEQESAANAEYDTFVAQHEHAELHGDVIADLMEAKGWSPQQAYYELKVWAINNGYDFSQPLAPQRQSAPTEETQQPTPPRASKPVPSGTRDVAATPRAEVQAEDGFLYNASDDWDRIVREEMRRIGL